MTEENQTEEIEQTEEENTKPLALELKSAADTLSLSNGKHSITLTSSSLSVIELSNLFLQFMANETMINFFNGTVKPQEPQINTAIDYIQ